MVLFDTWNYPNGIWISEEVIQIANIKEISRLEQP
jgi:hypothetical protein